MKREVFHMQTYSTEVYLPCAIPNISYASRRKSFLDFQQKLYISLTPMSAIPFNFGGLIFIGTAAYFVDDFEMFIDLDREEKTLSQHLFDHPEWKKELEELNAIGGIRFIPSKNNFSYSSEAYAYKKQYQGKNWTNFSLSPITFELDITNNCNALCVHCSRDSGTSESFLSFYKIKKILEQCERFKVQELFVMGGEPLLHPSFESIIKTARDYGIKSIFTSSNGILITPKVAEILAKYSIYVQISIHGASANTHESITRCKGSFKKACDAVKLLRSKNIKVGISFTLLEINKKDIYSIPELALNLRANSLRYLALSDIGRGKQLKRISDSERNEIGKKLKEIHDVFSKQGLEIAVSGFPSITSISEQATLYGCPAGITHIHMDYKGIISLCGSVEGYQIDNQKQHTNILDVWHEEKLRKVRIASQCKCSYRYICSGGCKANIYSASEKDGNCLC
ncbi:MAG: radical SAM protein [Candidatus Methanoperedens sp.]|nr:radical SAM protein [Candidatus Methanoperedens sp. BLZ2]MBZ0175893.1 radical SAM protein [Candidatus Methanoperedens nitroreducens]MCX9076405.1 radical SAM protein [Candidatus Methanoperedens sp.]MCX9089640.1 radical SAM protein [Candidatus Methanoperedens sp.]